MKDFLFIFTVLGLTVFCAFLTYLIFSPKKVEKKEVVKKVKKQTVKKETKRKKRIVITDELVNRAKVLHANNVNPKEIMRVTGMSKSALYRAIAPKKEQQEMVLH